MNILYAAFLIAICILFVFMGVGLLGLHPIFGIVIPYAALVIFIAGLIYRILKWASSPVPYHIPTVCGQQKSHPWIKRNNVDSPTTTAGVIAYIALEVFLFRSLFRNDRVKLREEQRIVYGGNKLLWLGGLAFHWSLFIILFRHLRLFTEPVPSLVLFVRSVDGILHTTFPLIYISDFIILTSLTYLFLRRVIIPQLRYISLLSDYFTLLLILGVVISGFLMRFFFRENVLGAKKLAMGILTFHPSVPQDLGLIFYIHLFFVSVLFAYFPLSKLMHAPGIFLSPTINLKNNSRMRRHSNPWDYPVKVHTYEEYEDEFREKIKQVGLPLEKE